MGGPSMSTDVVVQTQDERMVKNPHLTRQLSIIDSDRLANQKVYIIGCGAIGSFAALALVKMGITKLEVWDADEVDIVNMSNQFFRTKDIGKNKAKALHDLILDFTDVSIKYHEELFEDGTGCRSYFNNEDAIVISAVDSMKVRKAIYTEIVENKLSQHVKYIIDPRMSAETLSQFAANMTDENSMNNYSNTLYSDENSVAERCTAKSTIYTVTSSTGLICKTVKNIIMQQKYPKSVLWDIKESGPDSMQMFGAQA